MGTGAILNLQTVRTKKKIMRAFIAIELPQEIKDYLAKVQAKLKTANADVKWVNPQNIHLTLKFLGEIDEKQLNQISQILDDVAGNKAQFYIHLASFGAFPSIKSARVIWAGIDKGDPESKEIAGELEEKIEKIGIPKEERAFSSHITIGRTRSSKNRQQLSQELENLTDESGKLPAEFKTERITLFKSTLTPKGPIYEILKEAHLKTT
jgi:2'-5' RNA ligase